MKKRYILTIILLFFLCTPFNINAAFDAEINGSAVRIRTGPGTNNSVIVSVNAGTSIKVVDKTLYEGKGCNSKWLKIIHNEKEGYVCSEFVTFLNTSYAGINVIDWTARVSGNNVSVRKTASSKGKLIETLTLGANVTILDTSGNFYKIKYYGEKVGYISKDYVVKKSDITAMDEEYTKVLKAKGFPDSYIPYLTYLHKKYPNWEFNADKNNRSFTTSVDKENGKCYMQTKNDNYRTSSTPAEGSSWFRVNAGVIAFYMDPRNWLLEDRIFMFEKLDYDKNLEKEYPVIIKSIFGSGKLGDDKYTIPMFNAAKSLGISPIHVASRIRLEVGASGSASTDGREFTWKGKTYSGYYNFFNIGAYETTIDGVKYSAVTRGLAYAAKLVGRTTGEPWNNIETAIREGSSTLANNYVTKGQQTIFYQKFNIGPNAGSPYAHQYMTNIQAPAIEGASSYKSYKKGGLLNSKLIFDIPVYKDGTLPAYTSLPKSGDTNNNLKSLSVVGYSLTPSFDEDILTYDSYIPKEATSITIDAKTSSDKATISGIGETKIDDDETDITITVTSEAGEEKKYVVTIYRVDDPTTVSMVLKKSNLNVNSSYIYNIKNQTKASVIKSALITSGARNVVIKNLKGQEIKDTDIVGTNYKVTISTLLESKTYTLSVRGDTDGDGKITILDLLDIRMHIKQETKLTGAKYIAGHVNSNKGNDRKVGSDDINILDLLDIRLHITKEKLL